MSIAGGGAYDKYLVTTGGDRLIVLLGAAFIVLSSKISKSSHRGARTAVFIVLGISAVVPVTHGLLTHGVYRMRHEMGLDWLVLSGALYIAGALL